MTSARRKHRDASHRVALDLGFGCWTFCPEPAVLKTAADAGDGSHYVFDCEYCKGSGICARECPTGFILMADEATRP